MGATKCQHSGASTGHVCSLSHHHDWRWGCHHVLDGPVDSWEVHTRLGTGTHAFREKEVAIAIGARRVP